MERQQCQRQRKRSRKRKQQRHRQCQHNSIVPHRPQLPANHKSCSSTTTTPDQSQARTPTPDEPKAIGRTDEKTKQNAVAAAHPPVNHRRIPRILHSFSMKRKIRQPRLEPPKATVTYSEITPIIVALPRLAFFTIKNEPSAVVMRKCLLPIQWGTRFQERPY